MATRAQELPERRYWLFQANPRGGDDLRVYLRGKKRVWWRATRHRKPAEHMHKGDGVVLWQTWGDGPDAAGAYAIGRLTGKFQRSGRGRWQSQVQLDRVRQTEPITPETLKTRKVLSSLPVLRRSGAQGSNFVLSRDQWYAFLSACGETQGKDEDDHLTVLGSTELSSARAPLPTMRSRSCIAQGRDSYVVQWPEDALVERYVVHMGRKGITMETRRMGRRLRCDLYDEARKNLIEAKASVTRESIRMAIGELADYKRFVKPTYLSVLLPRRPEKDLENLLRAEGIFAIWRSGRAFTDNARGRFS